MLTWVVRRILGEAKACEVEQRLHGHQRAHEESVESIEEMDGRSLDLESRFKGYVIDSLGRRRILERELAELRYPELHKPQLGVVAAVTRGGDVPPSWPGSVTVIITNFNYGRYVEQALDSVLAQTHTQIELMVIDDSSTDSSPDVLTRALAHVTSVPWQLVQLRHNIGLPAARNIGVRLSQGEFVFVLDADNHMLPECIEAHIRAAQEHNADAAYAIIRTFGTASRLLSDAPFSRDSLARGPYIDAMALFRRSALLEMGMYATQPALYGWEDYELWVRFAARENPVVFIPSELSHYRLHDQNMISLASMDTRGAWAYLFETYPMVFGDMSAEAREKEAGQRARLIARAGRTVSARESRLTVLCGCASRP